MVENKKIVVRPNKIWKSDLADILNMSPSSLSNWLNVIEYDELSKLHYRKTQRCLFRPQIEYLFPTGLEVDYETAKRMKLL